MEMLSNNYLALGLVVTLISCAGCDPRDFLPIPGAEVIQPPTESLVTSPVYFEMDAKHWEIVPASEAGERAGYFVIILNEECLDEGELVPFDGPYVHLQDGSFSAWLDLLPGRYEACLQIATGRHRATRLTDKVVFEVVD